MTKTNQTGFGFRRLPLAEREALLTFKDSDYLFFCEDLTILNLLIKKGLVKPKTRPYTLTSSGRKQLQIELALEYDPH
jgi:hypothetical protein